MLSEDYILDENAEVKIEKVFEYDAQIAHIDIHGRNFYKYHSSTVMENISEFNTCTELIHPALAQIEYLYISMVSRRHSFLADLTVFKREPEIIFKYYQNFTLKHAINSKAKECNSTKKYIIILGVAHAIWYLSLNNVKIFFPTAERIFLDDNFYPKMACHGVFSVDIANTSPNNGIQDKSLQFLFALLVIEVFTLNRPPLNAKTIPIPKDMPQKLKDMLTRCLSVNVSISFEEIYTQLAKSPDVLLPDVDRIEYEAYVQSLSYSGKFVLDNFMDIPVLVRNWMNIAENIVDNPDKTAYPKGERSYVKELAEGFRDGVNEIPKNDKAALYYTILAVEYSDLDPQVAIDLLSYLSPSDSYYERVVAPLCYRSNRLSIQLDDITAINQPLLVPQQHWPKFNSNNPQDLLFLVRSYIEGLNGFPKSPLSARIFLKKAIATKNAEALLVAGSFYEHGIANIPNYKKAMMYYIDAGNAGIKEAQAKFDRCRDSQRASNVFPNDIAGKTLNIYESAYKFKEKSSCLKVAQWYLFGEHGFGKNLRNAYDFYLRAAASDPNIYSNLGDMFRKGYIFPRNIKKAMKLYHMGNISGDKRSKWYDNILNLHRFVPHEGMSIEKLLNFIEEHYADRTCSRCFDDAMIIPRTSYMLSLCNFPTLKNHISYRITPEKLSDFYQKKYNRDDYIFSPKIVVKVPDSAPFEYNKLQQNSCFNDCKPKDLLLMMYTFKYLNEHHYYSNITWFKENGKDPFAFLIPPSEIGFHSNLKKWTTTENARQLKIPNDEIKNRNTHEICAHCIMQQLAPHLFSIDKDIDHYIKDLLEENDTNTNEEEKSEFNDTYKRILYFKRWSAPLIKTEEIFQSKRLITDSSGVDANNENNIEIAKKYFYGNDGYPVNYEEAFKYFVLSLQNSKDAGYYAGYMAINGVGTTQDPREAINKYLLKASGDPRAIRLRAFFDDLRSQINDLFGNIFVKNDTSFKTFKYLYPTVDSWRKKVYRKCNKDLYNEIKVLCGDDPAYTLQLYLMNSNSTKIIGEFVSRSIAMPNIDSIHFLYSDCKCQIKKQDLHVLLKDGSHMNCPRDVYRKVKMSIIQGNKKETSRMINRYQSVDDPRLQCILGNMYGNGFGTKLDLKIALGYYNEAADKSPKAMRCVANYLKHDDFDKACNIFKYLIKANENNFIYADYMTQYALFIQDADPVRAHKIFIEMANKYLIPRCQYLAAKDFMNGIGCLKDEKKGIKYLKTAVYYNESNALLLYVKLTIKNKHKLNIDHQECRSMIKKAAKINIRARYYYGRLQISGIGLYVNINKGIDNLIFSFNHGLVKSGFYVFKFKYENSPNPEEVKCGKETYLYPSAELGYYKAQLEVAFSAYLNQDPHEIDICAKALAKYNVKITATRSRKSHKFSLKLDENEIGLDNQNNAEALLIKLIACQKAKYKRAMEVLRAIKKDYDFYQHDE